jgi:hypothetical protein
MTFRQQQFSFFQRISPTLLRQDLLTCSDEFHGQVFPAESVKSTADVDTINPVNVYDVIKNIDLMRCDCSQRR